MKNFQLSTKKSPLFHNKRLYTAIICLKNHPKFFLKELSIPLLVYSNDTCRLFLVQRLLSYLFPPRRGKQYGNIFDTVYILWQGVKGFQPYFQLCFLITSLIIGSFHTEFIKRIEERTLIASSPKISYTVLPESIIA